MKKTKLSLLLFSLVYIFHVKAYGAKNENSDLSIKISNPSYRLLNLAIPRFSVSHKNSSLKKLANRMRTSLYKLSDYTGVFRVVSEKAYSGFERSKKNKSTLLSDFKGTDYSQWKKIGIEAVLKIKLTSKSHTTSVSVEAIDTVQSKKFLSKTYQINSHQSQLTISKKILDEIQKHYTKMPGVFSSKIVFIGKKTKRSQKQIYTCDVDGSNLKQITYSKSLNMSPSWGAQQKSIIYTSYRKRNPDLYMINLSSLKSKILSEYKGINSGGSYDHHGGNVIYTANSKKSMSLFSLNLSTRKREQITFSKRNLHVDPIVSPDGKWLAYVSDGYGNPHVMTAKINRLQHKGKKIIRLTNHKRLTYTGWYNTMPTWSPSGKEIVYASFDKSEKRFDLFKMTNEGKKAMRLTSNSGNNEAPTWSPNGRSLVFHSSRKKPSKNSYQLYIMNKDGTNQRPIKIKLYLAKDPKWAY